MSLIPFGFWAASGAGGAAGAFDLLETTTLTSSASSVTFSGLGAYTDYKHLQVRWITRTNNASGFDIMAMRVNNDTGTNYTYHVLNGDGSSVTSYGDVSQDKAQLLSRMAAASTPTNIFSSGITDVLDYSSSKNTTIRTLSGATNVADASQRRINLMSNLWTNTAAVTSLSFISWYGASFIAGSRFSLIGIK